ncbi:MAG: hypothetical protein NC079_11645 [Clostridium sp.]|nr:hypothetical protein [Acetatifactor muris]MCM1527963.1 hypothetical protein [Bacteroides sp.]MCM1564243.1 hypothetical protein [Clostridium sp.]
MDIVEIVRNLLEFLRVHDGNRRTCDAMEECLGLLQSDLTKEQREREIRRVGDTITFLLEQADGTASQETGANSDRQKFSDDVRRKLEECRQECLAMAERKCAEQTALIEQYENEFLTEMNVALNGDRMKERENFSELVNRSRLRLSANIRSVLKEFTENVMYEYDFCMERVRKAFVETKIAAYHVSNREMNDTVLANYDSMQRNLLAEDQSYKYPEEPFREFTDRVGVRMEKIAARANRLTLALKLLPLLLYVAKHVIDNYIIQKETWVDKLMNFLLTWMQDAVQKGSENREWLLNLAQVLLQFAADHGEAFAITVEFLTLFFFVGWLYFIYIKIIGKRRQKSLYRKQQAVVRPEAEKFLRNLNIRGEIQRILTDKEKFIAERYMQKHALLFEKLGTGEPGKTGGGSAGSELRKLQHAYMEYVNKSM